MWLSTRKNSKAPAGQVGLAPSRVFRLSVAVLLVVQVCSGLSAEKFSISGNDVKRTSSQGSDRTTILGEAVFKSERFEIRADELSIYGKNGRYLEASGSVLIKDKEKQMNLSGETLFFDRDEDVLTLKGNCLLEDFKNEMVLRGGIIEHRNKENVTTIQIGVRILKKDLNARAEMLVYRRDTDMAELSGLPVVFQKDNEYRARQITINLKTEEISMVGRVSGQIKGD